MKATARSSPAAILLCSVYKSRHGGSLYFQQFAKVLNDEGWTLGLMSKHEYRDDPVFLWQVMLSGFFCSGLSCLPARLKDLVTVIRKVMSDKPDLLVVQGDLPRLSYLFLQIWVPLMFIRQDSILTCPANDRFLPVSQKICQKAAGFSCLKVDRKEGCLRGLSFAKKCGRIVYRLRDVLLIKALKNFTGNSLHILQAHGRPDGALIRPPGPQARTAEEKQRDLHTLVFCGRLERTKGPQDALNILSLLPDNYSLKMLGEGDMRSELEAMAMEPGLKGRVTFFGWVNAEQRDQHLARAGVLVMPSLADEAFGMAGVEAFAAGTPVVAYRTGGVAEWCLPNAGEMVESGNYTDAASAVLKITSSQATWQGYSQAARHHARAHHDRKFFREEVLAAVNSCVKQFYPGGTR